MIFSSPRLQNILRNLTIFLINSFVLKTLFPWSLFLISTKALDYRWGIFNQLNAPFWFEFLLGILILDFSLFFWHFINHKIKFFWRFHQAHHSDDVFDPTTAIRFHIGELSLSFVYKCILVGLLGLQPFSVLVFEVIFTVFNFFIHSRIILPNKALIEFEKIFVSPRMHLIHHSVEVAEQQKNFGTVFSFWDHQCKSFLSKNVSSDYPTGRLGKKNNLLTFLFKLDK